MENAYSENDSTMILEDDSQLILSESTLLQLQPAS